MIDSTPLVSVIITCYNSQEFIEDAIVSVLRNKYENVEIIIVDDNSTDESLKILRKYEKQDKRIKVYANKENLGDYPNRNYASQLANGKYIKYLDSDDILYTYGLQIMVESMEMFPEAGLGMMWGDVTFEPSPILIESRKAFELYFMQDQWLCVGPTGSIYRRDCFFNVGGFSDMPFIGDIDLNLKLAAKYPVVRFHYDLVFYRIREGQQLAIGQNIDGYPTLKYLIEKKNLNSIDCPLEINQKIFAQKKINKRQTKIALKFFLKSFKFKDLRELVVNSSLGWKYFFSSLFE
jgi:glycosyltransferase involved in cell wall biosynthesis